VPPTVISVQTLECGCKLQRSCFDTSAQTRGAILHQLLCTGACRQEATCHLHQEVLPVLPSQTRDSAPAPAPSPE